MGRTLAIGDIHGCFNALRTLEEFVGIDADDSVITLGDYVNRGPNSRAVIEWLIHHHEVGHLVALRGNHEVMMLNSRDDERSQQIWLNVGGRETVRSYAPVDGDPGRVSDIPDSHWRFLEQKLLAIHETEHHYFVHANVYPHHALDDQPEYMLYWERFDDCSPHQSGKTMVCGHTSQKDGLPKNRGYAICIDTWACGQGWLTCLDVDAGTIWQATEDGRTRKMALEEV